jgi:hypothetical protein
MGQEGLLELFGALGAGEVARLHLHRRPLANRGAGHAVAYTLHYSYIFHDVFIFIIRFVHAFVARLL